MTQPKISAEALLQAIGDVVAEEKNLSSVRDWILRRARELTAAQPSADDENVELLAM